MTSTYPNTPELVPERVRIIDAQSARTKDAVIDRIAAVLADAYHRSDPNGWAARIRRRETFSTTGIGRHFALVHDFQRADEVVETVHPEVDLWLFLLPAGIDWEALDEQPVHVIACPVFRHGGETGGYLTVLSAIQKAWAKVTAEENMTLTAMNAEDAAGWINALAAGQVGS